MARRNSRFVVVELSGRIGNQLFQFATGLGVARDAGADLLFTARRVASPDLLLPDLIGGLYVEATKLDLLRVGQFDWEVRPQSLWSSVSLHGVRLVRRARGRTPPSVTVWVDTGRFRPAVFDRDLPMYVQGHFQSERYFARHADEVAGAIRWPSDTPRLPHADTPTVGVSFRRGDYNELGWTLPMDYYDRAIELMVRRFGPVTFLPFGDDRAFVELVADRIARQGAVIDVLSIADDPISQLSLFSQCDHCVISNSSFAWWGAWIGDQRLSGERLVIAPEEYRGPDRVPARWTTIATGSPLL